MSTLSVGFRGVWIVSGVVAGMLLVATPPLGAAPEVKPSAELLLRSEFFSTPSSAAGKDTDYSFFNARLRPALSLTWPSFTIEGTVQAAATLNLPENGAFAAGPAYYGANGITDPGRVSLLELNARYVRNGFEARIGRQKFADGAETKIAVPYLQTIKTRRLAERLLGNWDWVNVGRRYDGLTVGYGRPTLRGDAFALRPLAGGVNYRDAHEWLDNLTVLGASMTSPYGGLIPKTEARIFGIHYLDDRKGARAAAGDEIRITTVGASFLAGNERSDILAWFAYQVGDWGTTDHRGYAFILETGRRFDWIPEGIVVRAGYAQASGDSDPLDHESFFNLLPTNHKWYGSMDYSAFSNLRDVNVEALWSYRKKLQTRLGAHLFYLTDTKDAWYGGSGAFNEDALGYLARRPASGSFTSSALGDEVDLDLTWNVRGNHKLMAGGGAFLGGKAAEEVLPEESDGLWAYVQAVLVTP